MLLAHQLEQRGCTTIIASSRDFVRLMRFWKPDVEVINTVGQIRRCGELAPDTATVVLPGEGANTKKHYDAIHLANPPGTYEQAERFLLWSKKTEEFLHDILPSVDHRIIRVCGNPRLDMIEYNPDLLSIPPEGKTIGFISRYHTFNRYNAVPAIFSMQRPENTMESCGNWRTSSA